MADVPFPESASREEAALLRGQDPRASAVAGRSAQTSPAREHPPAEPPSSSSATPDRAPRSPPAPGSRGGSRPDVFAEHAWTEHGVRVLPGSFFASKAHIRISCGLPALDLDEALAALGKALDTAPRT